MPDKDATTTEKAPRLLIVRFSSFGDIVQALGVPAAFKRRFPNAEIDWPVREDFKGLVEPHPLISKVHAFNRKLGFKDLLKTSWLLAKQDYTHVYDAHRNLRSAVVRWAFRLHALVSFGKSAPLILSRPKHRLRRWLLFRFRLNVLPRPFRGAESFLWPLERWGLETKLAKPPQFFTRSELSEAALTRLASLPSPRVALAPSAAWKMKRWPISHWKALMAGLEDVGFILLGGPEDHFISELEIAAPGRVVNLAGQLSLAESAALLKQADLVIANDTGLLHVADQMGRPTLALIGPTAFGYTSQPNSENLEIELSCKPCSKDGRGRCINSVYQRCLVELTPAQVIEAARRKLFEDKKP